MDACVVKPEKEMGDTAATEAAATLQQILASSGALVSPLQLFPTTGDGASQSTSSLPFMAMSPYQMMVLPQSLLSAHGVSTSASGGDGHAAKLEKGSVSVVSAGQSVADLLQKRDKDGTIGGDVLNQLVSAAVNQSSDRGNSTVKSATDHLKPPKKPLTPYMTFSKMIWPRVKAANAHLSSVCELGAIVGSMWRALDPADKQYYNDQFTREKIAYDEELRAYLKATGLTASDLVKPKPKKKDPRPSTSSSSQQLLQQQAARAAAANGSSPATALTSTGQQLVQSLIGLQPQHDGLGNTQAGTPEGWTNQAAQQLLAQMGLAGQTLFANSDGTISVDGSLLTIQGRPVQLASHDQVAAVSSASTEAASESSRGWAWHQPAATTTASSSSSESGGAGMVVYQLLTNGSAADGGTSAAAAGGGTQQPSVPVYYSVDAYGQLVSTTKPPSVAVSANESRLQQEVAGLRTALDEKSREADTLRSQLVELCATIERYRSIGGGNNGGEQHQQAIKAEQSGSPGANSDTMPSSEALATGGNGE